MQLYIDSSDIDEISDILSSGMSSGVTTNPSLLKNALEKHKVDNLEQYIKAILKLIGKETKISLQVSGRDPSADAMIKEGRKLWDKFSRINNNAVIKIPVNPSCDEKSEYFGHGLRAIRVLSSEDVPVNVTVIERVEQAVLAAYAGARYVSPFVGRIDDFIRANLGVKFEKGDYFSANGVSINGVLVDDCYGNHSGLHLLERIIDEFDKRGLFGNTKILAASVRNIEQVKEIWKLGPDITTLPYHVFKEYMGEIRKMLEHPKTWEGARKFRDDVPEEYSRLLE